MTFRVAIYARYSSDSHSAASIDDQIRLCRERIVKEGWIVAETYCDAAMSGASTLRPGYQAMLEAAREGSCNIVVAEAFDRLSRDQEDIAGLFKRLTFADTRILTLSEGFISELHIGLPARSDYACRCWFTGRWRSWKYATHHLNRHASVNGSAWNARAGN